MSYEDTRTRAEHLQWAKDRALEYCDRGDREGAIASLVSDLNKHSGTADHVAGQLAVMQLMAGQLSTPGEVRHFIEGVN